MSAPEPKTPEIADMMEALRRSYELGRLVPFAGAGISCPPPSSVPHANDLKALFLAGLAHDFNVFPALHERLARLGLEAMISIIGEYAPGFVHEFMNVVSSITTANWTHKAVALLAMKSRLCVTTNFDLLLEHAFVRGGRTFDVVLHTPQQLEACADRIGMDCTLLKLHGSSDTTDIESLGVTLQAVGKAIATRGIAAACAVTGDRDLLVLGYRGRDPDIVEALSRGAGQVFWCWHSSDAATPSIGRHADNPVAAALCRSRHAIEFKCDTTRFLRLLLSHASLSFPEEDVVRAPLRTAAQLGNRIRDLLAHLPRAVRQAVTARCMKALGLLKESNELLADAQRDIGDVDSEIKVGILLQVADNLREINQPASRSAASAVLGEVESQILHVSHPDKLALFRAHMAAIRSFLEQYSGCRDLALTLAENGRELLRTRSSVIETPSQRHHYSMQEMALRCDMEAGNALFWRSNRVGDVYTEDLLRSCARYIIALRDAVRWQNLRFEALLLENIAQTHNEWILRCRAPDTDVQEAMRFGVQARVIALHLLEYIGDEVARGRSCINMASEFARTRDWPEGVVESARRLRVSLTAEDIFGVGLALDKMAESLSHYELRWSDALYEASISAYEKFTTHPEYAGNVRDKMGKEAPLRGISVLDDYRARPVPIGEFLSFAEQVRERIDAGRYLS